MVSAHSGLLNLPFSDPPASGLFAQVRPAKNFLTVLRNMCTNETRMDEQDIPTSPASLGRDLLDYANNVDDGGKHGRIVELFPFIYDASHKLGVRAISRWLDEQNTPISPATISKALRAPEGMLRAFTEVAQAQAWRIAQRYNVSTRRLLYASMEQFDDLLKKSPVVPNDQAHSNATDDACEYAAGFLRERWFVLSFPTREFCRQFLTTYAGEHKAVEE
jgi:hypothetical protein